MSTNQKFQIGDLVGDFWARPYLRSKKYDYDLAVVLSVDEEKKSLYVYYFRDISFTSFDLRKMACPKRGNNRDMNHFIKIKKKSQ